MSLEPHPPLVAIATISHRDSVRLPCAMTTLPSLLHRAAFTAALAGLLTLGSVSRAEEAASAWTDRDTGLANQYLSLLVSQPEYGRVIDLLWSLYDRHDSTALLIENVTIQAQSNRHPSVLMVLGHLYRKGGNLTKAASIYEEVIKANALNAKALQARAAVAQEMGDPTTAWRLIGQHSAQLLDADPRKVEVLLQLGSLALAAGKNDEAVKAWENAAKLKTGDFDLIRQVAEFILRAGFPDRAAAFYSTLTEQSDPQRRLDALYDLARIHEHADQFEQADAALAEGLALLDFRDGRYADFFLRRVRLHERFGSLDDLRQQLTKSATQKPVSEHALRDLVRFHEITVDTDAHLSALRELVKQLPQVDEYRWELVRALLDHDGADEAAKLLDESLKGDGSDLPAIVFLRCEADLRRGDASGATSRIEKLLKAQGASPELEKQALAFAQQRALDAVIEMILKSRLERDPSKSESVFELAVFYRARKDMAAADVLLRRFTQGAATEEERQRRLNDAAAFLASGSDLDSAIILARESVAKPSAGRDELLRLADLLTEHGDKEEALSFLEKAWQAGKSDEDGVDVDDRIYSLLMGDEKKQVRKNKGSGGDFQLPDAFTGKGFATTDEAQVKQPMPEAVLEKVRQMFGLPKEQKLSDKTPREIFRAAWWAVRSEMPDEAYLAFRLLQSGVSSDLSLEAERLLLDLALVDKNTALAMRVLRRLIARDETSKVRYSLRLSELLLEDEQTASTAGAVGLSAERTGWRLAEASPLPALRATVFLERAFHDMPDSDQLLQALTQCYTLQRRQEDALKLWKNAIDRASGGAAVTLMERYAEMLLRQMKLPEFIVTQIRIVETETDVKRRREAYKRFLDRLLWSEQGGDLSPELLKARLKSVSDALLLQVKRHPFDGFYHEALAQVYEREGNAAKSFAAMKQAYYTSPDTPFSLDQLREAAVRVQDMKSAIYFQKKIAASAGPKELAAESRRLVEMLEQTFQIAEADRVRRRLESRFSQDVASLEGLADHYRSTGQDEAERRVYEQVARVRPWDARSQLRLALKSLRLADDEAAQKYLREICTRTVSDAFKTKVSGPKLLPLPLAEFRKVGAPGPVSEITAVLDTVPALKAEEVTALRAYLSLPRAEFSELPDAVPLIRLRAIEELSKLVGRGDSVKRAAWISECSRGQGGVRTAVEKLWAFYFVRAGDEFRSELRRVMATGSSFEAQFCQLWLILRSGGMAEGLRWSEQTGLDYEVQESRKRLLLAVGAMLADLDTFRYERGELTLLGTVRSMSVVDILRRLQDHQRYPEALELGESLRLHNPGLADGFTFSLARIAESAERWDLARQYLSRVVRGPVRPEAYRGTYDPYLFSLSAANRLAVSAEEREKNLRAAWRHLQATPSSAMTRLRKSAVAGLAGAPETAAAEMQGFITRDLLPARPMGEMKSMPMSQAAVRYEEPMHLRTLWVETREIEARFVQEGMGQVIQQVNDGLTAQWGGVGLSSRSGLEFGEWRLGHLVRKMRDVDYPTRLRMLREHLASVDMKLEVSVDTLSELGGRLETSGMSREAIEVYGLLPSRAPANPEYAQWLIRVSESALDTKTGLKFTLQLLNAEPPMKPPQPGDEVLREKHAHFLALDFDLAELHRRGYLPQITHVLQGRIPHEVPYLRELALLHEKLGQDTLALAAWDRLHEAFIKNAESGILPDAESCVRRAKLLIKLNKPVAALVALRPVPLTDKSGEQSRVALMLRADLVAKAQDWDEFRELMTLAVEIKSIDCIAHLTELSRVQGRGAEALNFLTQAERSLKDDGARFRMRLELLKLLAHETTWTPERGRSQVAALMRVRSRDRETLQQFVDWLGTQALGANRAAWISLLRAESRAGVDRPLAALALCAFAEGAPESIGDDLSQGWQAVREGDRICLELGAETLLKEAHAGWAWRACLALQDLPTLRLDGRKLPLMLRVADALGDRSIVQEIFAEVVRMPFPGGVQTVAWAKALEESGENDLARELYLAALDRLVATNGMQSDLSAAWTRHLIQRREFESAESYLMHALWTLPNEAPKLLFDLYAAWGRLSDVRAELRKFHLPGGIEKEVLFLAAQSLGIPPPVTSVPSS